MRSLASKSSCTTHLVLPSSAFQTVLREGVGFFQFLTQLQVALVATAGDVPSLNRFAPHGARDPITQLFELIAAEMRSQGIILLGAQQQASQVSSKVIENAGIKVLGRTGSLELTQPVWRSLSPSARAKAVALTVDEKLILQDSFRAPMHVRVPYPPWAMRREEVDVRAGGAAPAGLNPLTLEDF